MFYSTTRGNDNVDDDDYDRDGKLINLSFIRIVW